ncbi:hypothetical protein SCP_1104200 [Sparassis crispa]|uniref:HNH nuclease domain-containing protein n=1 Tax=Sparassis crispa TaxID=139825 RepID=A0A401GZZ8_9APHY|nr:hypothetical protein SCP_1104200 [Sparassis crispa]GBE87743.1 hypothetical protein SCP_1104200 [Sparassis crispa]
MPKWHAVYKYILRDFTPNPPPEAIVTLHIPLRDFSDIDSLYWAAALDIPTSCLPNFSSYPLRWLCYLSFCLTGSRGDLKRSSQADSPHVNYDDQTALGESASFYFHPERSAFLIDPDMCARELPCETDTENSDGDELWDHLMEREHAECVATGTPHDLCSAEHLIPASKGNKYISLLTRGRRYDDADDAIVDSINDPRNALFVNLLLRSAIGAMDAAFLQTPNFILKPEHLNSQYTGGSHTFLHYFPRPSEIADNIKPYIPHGQPIRLPEPRNRDTWPPETIFAACYGCAALNTWPVHSFVERVREEWVGKGEMPLDLPDDANRKQPPMHVWSKAAQERRAERSETEEVWDILTMYQELLHGAAQERGQQRARENTRERVNTWLHTTEDEE